MERMPIGEIEPMSMKDRGEDIEEYTLYLTGYWVQQNPDRAGEKIYERMKKNYEDSLIRPVPPEVH